MRRFDFLLGGLAALSMLAPSLHAATKPAVAPMDEKFMKDAAMDGMAEVKLGRLAADKASKDDVKAFGRMMADDHTKANQELEGLATKKQVTVPGFLKKEHQALNARLEKLSGEAFDAAYMTAMVKEHQKAVALFSRESKTGKDADAKAWAARTLPTLEKHLEHAKSLAPKPAGRK